MNYINAYAVPGLKREKKALFQATPENIIDLICITTGITWEKITGSRGRDMVLTARFMVCHFLFKYSIPNKSEIGRLINRDHTSVINALRTFKDLYDTEESVRKMSTQISSIIENK